MAGAGAGEGGDREGRFTVGARRWGPGLFGMALREAVAQGEARHVGRARYGPPERDDD
jgi:hypothetical protein